MNIDHQIDFIKHLDIEAGEAFSEKRRTKGSNSDLPVRAGTEQSFFVEKSLASFASTVTGQLRSDVLQTMLLAQMAANKQFPNQESMFDWYRVFLNTLAKTGWVIEGINEQDYRTARADFELDSAIIDLLSGVLGQGYILIIRKTLDAIKSMTDEDRKIKAFDKNTKSVSQRGFQVSFANEEGGAVALQISTFLFNSTLDFRRLLFFKAESAATDFSYLIRKATLDTASYDDRIRKAVNDKIRHLLMTNISEIEI